ncbi:MAG: prepilin-type N-terminal cleavage/methylation domain-containing protein [Methylococcales bacterium]
MKLMTKSQKGFTLIEILIALVILSVGILGVGAMQLTSIKGNSKARQISEASNLAADRIELFMTLDYDAATFADADGDGTNEDTDGDGTDDNGGNFGLDDFTAATADGAADDDGDGTNDIFWNVAVNHPVADTKTVRIIVVPQNGGNNVKMTTIIENDI